MKFKYTVSGNGEIEYAAEDMKEDGVSESEAIEWCEEQAHVDVIEGAEFKVTLERID